MPHYFIMLMLGSTCFGHHCAHHQELTAGTAVNLAASAQIFWRVNGFRQKAHKSLFPVSLIVKHFPSRYTARRLSTDNSRSDFVLTCWSYRDHTVWWGHEFGTTGGNALLTTVTPVLYFCPWMDQKFRRISLKPLISTKPHVRFEEDMEKWKVYQRLGKGFSWNLRHCFAVSYVHCWKVIIIIIIIIIIIGATGTISKTFRK